jgi:hypothetical protein
VIKYLALRGNCWFEEGMKVGRDVGCRVIWVEGIVEMVLGEEGRGIIDVIRPMGVRYAVVNLPLVKSCKVRRCAPHWGREGVVRWGVF